MLKRPVYLSIDLDVLQSDLVTDWRVGVHEGDVMGEGYGDNHGRMSLEQLLALIKTIGETASVLPVTFVGSLKCWVNSAPQRGKRPWKR